MLERNSNLFNSSSDDYDVHTNQALGGPVRRQVENVFDLEVSVVAKIPQYGDNNYDKLIEYQSTIRNLAQIYEGDDARSSFSSDCKHGDDDKSDDESKEDDSGNDGGRKENNTKKTGR